MLKLAKMDELQNLSENILCLNHRNMDKNIKEILPVLNLEQVILEYFHLHYLLIFLYYCYY